MSNLKKLVESFTPVTYSRVQRGDRAYKETYELTVSELTRRYHGYAIEGSIGSHYTEVGVDKANCVFEHVIPAAKVRDMLLAGVLTVEQSLNTPTCLISKRNDDILREEGHVSSSPDYWCFFKRYNVFDEAKFVTYNGQVIEDLDAWTLEDHYRFFNIN
jgi:hypothetical protein